MDLTKLSDGDLLALQQGDLSRISDAGLQHLIDAQPPSHENFQGSFLGGVVQGARDPLDAGAQLLTHILPQSIVDKGNQLNNWLADKTGLVGIIPQNGMDAKIANDEQSYQQDRAASGRSGFDAGRMLGNVAATLPLGGGAMPARLGGQILKGGIQGGVIGAMQPVTNGEFLPEKLTQIGVGAGLGGALAPLSGYISGSNANKQAQQNILQAQNAPRDATLQAAQDFGYKVPASIVNPSMVNNGLESAVGKQVVQAEHSLNNNRVTENIARQYLNLPPDAPLTSDFLDSYASKLAQPYRDVASLNTTFHIPSGMNVPSDLGNKTVGMAGNSVRTISPSEALENWKQLNFDAKTLYNKIGKSPEDLARARNMENQADNLFQVIQQGTADSGNNDLSSALAKARVDIAKVHSIDDAVIQGGGFVDPRKFAKALQNGAPYTDELKTAAEFVNTFPTLNKPMSQIGSAGVHNANYKLASALGIGGTAVTGNPAVGVAMAALPEIGGYAAKKLIMSDLYQKLAANPRYGIGPTRALAQALSAYMPVTGADLGTRN